MWKVGLLIHVKSSSIPPFVLTSIQWLALFLFVFPCMHVQVQAWMIIPTSNGHFGSPLEGHMRPFGLTFTVGLACLQVFGGPLVSPQGYDDEWQVFWGGARPAGLVQAGRPKSGRLA